LEVGDVRREVIWEKKQKGRRGNKKGIRTGVAL
jgi:hypothetical protein